MSKYILPILLCETKLAFAETFYAASTLRVCQNTAANAMRPVAEPARPTSVETIVLRSSARLPFTMATEAQCSETVVGIMQENYSHHQDDQITVQSR